MRTIWKYPVPVQDRTVLRVPSDFDPLTVQVQGQSLCLWAAVDSDLPLAEVEVRVLGTGYPVPEDLGGEYYVGSVQDGVFVWHVFCRRVDS